MTNLKPLAHTFSSANININTNFLSASVLHQPHNYQHTLLEDDPQNPSRVKRFLTDADEQSLFLKRENSLKQRRIQIAKEDLVRQKTHQNHRRNEQIFFSKRTSTPKPRMNLCRERMNPFSAKALVKSQQIKKGKDGGLPFMLQHRSKKAEKSKQVIELDYINSLRSIKSRGNLRTQGGLQQQMRMINRLKGSKLYYQMIKEWHPTVK